MAKVMRQKYIVKRQLNIDSELNDYIRQKLGEFVAECKQNRVENSKHYVMENKPWIPLSKHQMVVPRSMNMVVLKAVAIFDPDTNMIVKQYSSMASACQVASFLHRLGFEYEMNQLVISTFKTNISKSSMDPSLLMFGYRWLRVADLRDGNFVLDKSRDNPNQVTSVALKVEQTEGDNDMTEGEERNNDEAKQDTVEKEVNEDDKVKEQTVTV